MPGPVWTLSLWCLVQVLVGITLLNFSNSSQGIPRWFALIEVVALIFLASLLVLGHRCPPWILVIVFVLNSLGAALATLHASGNTAVQASAWSLTWSVLYAALWMRRLLAAFAVAFSSLVLFSALVITDSLQALALTWILVTASWTTIVIGIGAHARGFDRSSRYDVLTGVLNRKGLDDYLSIHSNTDRAVTPRAIVVIDLDRFKTINDRYGHLAGDAILKEFGQHLRKTLRPDDLIVRIGGDEFLLLLPQTRADDASPLLDRLRRNSPAEWSGGLVDWPSGEDFESAFQRADARMYEDKRRANAAMFRDTQVEKLPPAC